MGDYDINYMQRTRDYYRAQGYSADYSWANFDDVPFTPVIKPLAQSRVAIITTAMPQNSPAKKLRNVVSTPVDPIPESMFTEDLSWDKQNTHTRDVSSFLPIEQLQALIAEGIVGELAPSFHSVPTEYSQRNTIETDAPLILAKCREEQVDLALLVPL